MLLKDEPKPTETPPAVTEQPKADTPLIGEAKPEAKAAPTITQEALAAKAAEFESKLAALGDMDMSVKQRETAIKKLEEQYAGLGDVGSSLPEGITPKMLAEALGKLKSGDEVAFVKAILRDKWSGETLMRWADQFDAEEISVEERVRRTLEAERKAESEKTAAEKAEAEKKAADEKAARDKADEEAADAEWTKKLTAAAEYLRANREKYPLTVRYDSYPRVDTERMVREQTLKWINDKNEIPTEEQIFQEVEREHREFLAHGSERKETDEDRFEKMERELKESRLRETSQPVLSGPARAKSGADEARERLLAWENEQKARGQLSYR